jgi:hypothetical protein
MIKLTIDNVQTNKKERYACDQKEHDFSLWMYHGMGIYNLIARFKTEDELKDFMAEVEKTKGSKFKVA